MMMTKKPVHVIDLAAEQGYIEYRDPQYVAAVEVGGIRTLLHVPMLKESELVGAFIYPARKFVRSPASRLRW